MNEADTDDVVVPDVVLVPVVEPVPVLEDVAEEEDVADFVGVVDVDTLGERVERKLEVDVVERVGLFTVDAVLDGRELCVVIGVEVPSVLAPVLFALYIFGVLVGPGVCDGTGRFEYDCVSENDGVKAAVSVLTTVRLAKTVVVTLIEGVLVATSAVLEIAAVSESDGENVIDGETESEGESVPGDRPVPFTQSPSVSLKKR